MPQFDPDNYLQKKSAVPQFDPDKYLSSKSGAATEDDRVSKILNANYISESDKKHLMALGSEGSVTVDETGKLQLHAAPAVNPGAQGYEAIEQPAINVIPHLSDSAIQSYPNTSRVFNRVADSVNSLTSPENMSIALLTAGSGSVVSKLVGAGFTASTAKSIVENRIEYHKETDPQKKLDLNTDLGVNLVFEALLVHGLSKGIKSDIANSRAADHLKTVPDDVLKAGKELLNDKKFTKTLPYDARLIDSELARRNGLPKTAEVLKQINPQDQTETLPGGIKASPEQVADIQRQTEQARTNETQSTATAEAPKTQEPTQPEKQTQGTGDAAGNAPPALRTAIRQSDETGVSVYTGENATSPHNEIIFQKSKEGIDLTDSERGFVDADGKFINRVDAARIALDNGTIDQATYDRAMDRGKTGSYTDFLKQNNLEDDAPARKAFAEIAAREDPDKGLHSEDLKKDITDTAGNKIQPNTPESHVGGVRPEKEVVASVPQAAPVSPQALGITHPMPEFIKKLSDIITKYSPAAKLEWPQGKQLANNVKGFVDTVMGKTMPKTTIADRPSGELGARWLSARSAAPHLSNVFSANVLEGTGIDPVEFGTALTEDNLRSIKQNFLDEAKNAKTEELKAEFEKKAAAVGTTIGGKKSPFKTEEQYQAFLSDPSTQAAIERHRSAWQETVDPMFKNSMSYDPEEVLPNRGLQTGARVNLYGIKEGEPTRSVVNTVREGTLTGTFKKKSPFGIQATGTGSYNTNYFDMMANTFGRQMESAAKNAFEKRLVESGNAVIDKPGQANILALPDGEGMTEFPLKRQTIIGDSGSVSQNQSIYVRKSLAQEYRTASNVDPAKRLPFLTPFFNIFNRAALAGLTDATVHVSNLSTVLMTRPGMMGSAWMDSLVSATGRLDIPVILTKAVIKGIKDNRAQMAELAEIGALREESPTRNPLGNLIKWADKTTRLVLDDAYKNLEKQGLVENTETNRREFVNQAGQYNKRAQGQVMRFFRDSGLAPFATAGRNFAALGLRTATMSPGVEAASGAAVAALRANVLSKWVGTAAFVVLSNYIITGQMGGRKGTPIGHIDTGKNDANGRPLTFDALTLVGLGRGLRTTGIRGYINAKQLGLSNKDAAESAWRDIANTAISPFAGPPVRTGMAMLFNQAPAIGVGKPLPVAPPGESQTLSNVKNALILSNPIIASINDSMQPGETWYDSVRRQFPRFTLTPQKPQEMLDKYPEIVRKAQARDYINDVISRARKLDPAVRQKYIDDALEKLSPEDREVAIKLLKYSGVEDVVPKSSFSIKKTRKTKIEK